MRVFKLSLEQKDFLQKEYSDNSLVNRVLSCEENGVFKIDIDTKIDFMDFIEDEAICWMDSNHEATSKTIMLESIRDDIYYQTN